MNLYESVGVLDYSYSDSYGYRLVVKVDQQISDFYRSLIPKWIKSNRQMYPAHISVVRKEVPPVLSAWEKYQNEPINFNYSPEIHFGSVYIWLNVFSTELEAIRRELGLPVSSQYTLPPEGFVKCFHCSIGNFKNL